MINLNSPTQLSILLFGGEITETTKEPVLNELGVPVTIKSGKSRGEIKYKNVTRTRKIRGFNIKPKAEWKTSKAGIYQTNEKILKIIVDTTPNEEARALCNGILEIRGREKLVGTYYEGFKKHLYEVDSCIHAQFSHCGYSKNNGDAGGGTDTGRLSCNRPNIQNVPK